MLEFKTRLDPEFLESYINKYGDYPKCYYEEKKEFEEYARTIAENKVEKTEEKTYEQENKELKYVNVPVWVMQDKKLQGKKGYLYSCILTLHTLEGCRASNEYFAKILKTSPNTVSQMVSDLKNMGYISIKQYREKGSYRVEKRYITPSKLV